MPLKLPQPGDTILEKYRLDSVIGEGGFAVVYAALDVTVSREVAVKVLKPGNDGYEITLVARFVREAKLVAGLSDPHTVRMFDFGRTETGLMFMVFELIGGEDLSVRFAREGAQRPPDVEHIVRQVLSALREAHARGLLHRDIKPANIRVFPYIDDPLRVKLMDFGIARAADGSGGVTRTGAVVGTVRYMSTEQLTGGQLSPASDLFSLGLVAYELLTGGRAPRDDIMLGRPPDLSSHGRLGVAVMAMLARDPAQRPQSVDAVLAILDSATDRKPQASRPSPARTGPVRVVEIEEDRRAGPAIIAALAVVGVLAGVGWSMSAEPPEPEARPVTSDRARGLTREAPSAPVKQPPALREPDDTGVVDASDKPRSGCGLPPLNGFQERPLMVNLESRSYDVEAPSHYDATEPWPVVFAFHSDGTGSKSLRSEARLRSGAEDHSALIVLPEGDGPIPWRGNGVVPFVRRVLDDVRANFCVDEERLFLLGNGSGGQAVDKLSCEPWVAGVFTMGHRARVESFPCEPSNPIPHLNLAPLKSGHLPIKGGPGCFLEEVISLEAHDERWVERNRCKPNPVAEKVRSSTCYAYDCAAEFTSCHLDGGMPWVGRNKRGVDVFNCDGDPADFPFTKRMWGFFDRAATWKGANPTDVR